jgi:hypothetical protein
VSYFSNSLSLMVSLPPSATLDYFVSHFSFNSWSQIELLIYPHGDWLRNKFVAAFPNLQNAPVQLYQPVCGNHLSCLSLYVLWRLLSSELYRHIRVPYLDAGKFKILCAGSRGSTLLTSGTAATLLNVAHPWGNDACHTYLHCSK